MKMLLNITSLKNQKMLKSQKIQTNFKYVEKAINANMYIVKKK